jgi:hypothetical protein
MSNQAKQFDTKPMYAAVASFSKGEREKAEAVLRADQAGMKAHWIESSEKALLENKLVDPDNPLKFDDLLTGVYASRGEKVLRIMLTDTGALSDKEKALKSKYRKEAPQYLKRFKSALDKLQNPKDPAARKVKTLREFIEEEVGKIEKRIANAEAPDIKSIKATIDALAALRATL